MFATVYPTPIEKVKDRFPKECELYSDADLTKLIGHADYLVNYVTRGRLENQIVYYSRSTDLEWLEFYKNMKTEAVLAQLEYWFHVGAETDLVMRYKSYTIGSSRHEYELTTISPRVHRILRMGGMMNIGVSL